MDQAKTTLLKVHPHIPTTDLCQKSLDLLEDAINVWFARKGIQADRVWYADRESDGRTSDFPKTNTSVEIVLTGSFLHRLFEAPLWPFQEFRIWVISSRVRNILIKQFGFNEGKIGLIPASELKPLLNHHQLPAGTVQSDSLPREWIYAGRISAGKNILGLLETVSFLQIEHKIPIQLTLFGKFEESKDPSFGRYQDFSNESLIMNAFQNLPWTLRPIFHDEVAQYEWLKGCNENHALVSFSTHMCEDFGTSPWIAKSRGLTCILSDWGGFADHIGDRVHHIPTRMIPQTYDNKILRLSKARALAQLLAHATPPVSSPSLSGETPRPFTKTEFLAPLQKFIDHYYPEVFMMVRNYFDRFADSAKGKSFFLEYRFIMAGGVFSDHIYAINETTPDTFATQKVCDAILMNQKNNITIEFVPTVNLLSKFFLENIDQYKKISIVNDSPGNQKIQELLTNLRPESF